MEVDSEGIRSQSCEVKMVLARWEELRCALFWCSQCAGSGTSQLMVPERKW